MNALTLSLRSPALRRRSTMLALLILATGCTTPRFLSKNAINQGQTVADIHQQQVLDNLAKFVYDRNSIPSFATATGGTAEATDTGQATATPVWLANGFSQITTAFMGSRVAKATWTLQPVTDPRKLELMRCAFQKAVANCGQGGPSEACPDCTKRFNSFYTGQPYKKNLAVKDMDPSPGVDCQLAYEIEPGNRVPGPGHPEGTGVVNSECINPGCCQWFSFGCKKCVPKDCGCIYVGSYCGTYVWVTTSEGRDELAKLTLAVLDYALNAPSLLPSKEVTAYLTADGHPTTSGSANIVIKTQIAAGEVSASVLGPDVHARKVLERDCPTFESSAEINTMRAQAQAASPEDRAILEGQLQEAIQQRQSDFIEALPPPTYVPLQPVQPQLQFEMGPALLQLEQQLDLLRTP